LHHAPAHSQMPQHRAFVIVEQEVFAGTCDVADH